MERSGRKIYTAPKAEKIRDYKTIDDWITDVMSERTGSEQTKATYLNYFAEFLDWVRVSVRDCVALDHRARCN